jgi:hypothetical protein
MKNIFMLITIVIIFSIPIGNIYAQTTENNNEYFIQNTQRNIIGNKKDIFDNSIQTKGLVSDVMGVVEDALDFVSDVAIFVYETASDILDRAQNYLENRVDDLFKFGHSLITLQFKEAAYDLFDFIVNSACGTLDSLGITVDTLTYLTVVDIDSQTKAYLERYNYLNGKVDLNDIVVHAYNPFTEVGAGEAITLYNHIYLLNEAAVPMAKTYSLSPSYNETYAINWYVYYHVKIEDRVTSSSEGITFSHNGETIQLKNSFGKNITFPHLGKYITSLNSLDSLSNEDKENIRYILDLLYEYNIAVLLHETVHVAQYTQKYKSQGEFTCEYIYEYFLDGYENSALEQQAFKAEALFLSDFAKRTGELI